MKDETVEAIRRILLQAPAETLEDPRLFPAAVMLLVYPKDGEHCILLNKRTQDVEHHKGEISFPGGARDPEDATLLDTALRETQEEMGVSSRDVDILGQLSDAATNSGFLIRTYVGTIPYPYRFQVSDSEIAEVLEVPITVLMNPANRREEVHLTHGRLVKWHSYAYNSHLIYGATARILTQFLDLLAQVPNQ